MAIAVDETSLVDWLACRAGPHICALPLANVLETLRPLPIEPFAQAPRFICGLSIIRGEPTPIVDARALFDEQRGNLRRLVTIKVRDRVIALGFDEVLGVHSLALAASSALPTLLQGAVGHIVSAIGTLDAEILLFLQTARIFPEGLLENLGTEGTP